MERSDWDDEPDDVPADPGPPQERWWRHPSEFAAGSAAAPLAEQADTPGRSRLPLVLAVSIIGIALAVVLVRFAAPDGGDVTVTATSLPGTDDPAALVPVSTNAPGVVELFVRDEPMTTAVALQGTRLVAPASGLELATAVTAMLPSGAMVEARVVAVDEQSGMAVLELDVPVATVSAGQAALLHEGDEVRAGTVPGRVAEIGVSATIGRSEHSHLLRLRLDSGVARGTLVVDRQNRAVGLCVGEDDDGLALAVPVELARSASLNIDAQGRVAVPWLGTEGRNAGDGEGAEVVTIEPGSPAEAAGLQEDDVIHAVDDIPVESMSALVLLVRDRLAGTPLELEVERDGATLTVSATVGTRPDASTSTTTTNAPADTAPTTPAAPVTSTPPSSGPNTTAPATSELPDSVPNSTPPPSAAD